MQFLKNASTLGTRVIRLAIPAYDCAPSERQVVSVTYAGVHILAAQSLPIYCLAFILPVCKLITLCPLISLVVIRYLTIYRSARSVTTRRVTLVSLNTARGIG